jgi:hypothetical protein
VGPTVGDDGRSDEVGFDDRLGDTLGRTDVVGLYDNGACVVGVEKLSPGKLGMDKLCVDQLGVDQLGVDPFWDTLGCTLLSTLNGVDAFPDFDDFLLIFDTFPDLDPRESADAQLLSQWDRVRLGLPDWRTGLERKDGKTLGCSSGGDLPAKDLSWKRRSFSTPLRPSHIITGDVIAINTTASNRLRSAASLSDLDDVGMEMCEFFPKSIGMLGCFMCVTAFSFEPMFGRKFIQRRRLNLCSTNSN